MKKEGNIARKYQLGAITLEFTEEGTIELTRGPTRTTNPERLTWRQGPAYEILTDFVHALATGGPGVEPPHAVAFRDAVRNALFKADPEWATREKVSEALCAELAIGRLQTHAGNGELLAKLVEDVFEKHVLHWKGYAGNNLIDRVDSALKSLSEYRSIWLKAASGVMEESPDFVSETDPDVAVANAFDMAEMLPRYIRKLKNDADHAKAAELNAIDRMENANTERDNWQAGAKKISEENEELLRKIAYLGDQVISLTGQNATLQSDLMLARDQRNDAQSVNQSYSKTVTELRGQLANVQASEQNAIKERDHMHTLANERAHDIEQLATEKTQWMNLANERAAFMNELTDKVTELQGQIAVFKTDLATARSLLDVGAARVKEVTEQNETLARSLAEEQLTSRSLRLERDNLEKQNVAANQKTKDLENAANVYHVELGCGDAIPRRPIKVTTTDRAGDLEHTETLEFSPHSVEAQAAQAWQDGFEAKFRELLRDSNLSLAEIAVVTGIANSFGCKGKNCGSIDPRNHSVECQTEHEEAVGGYYGSEDTTPYAAEQLRRYIWILTGEEPAQDVAERIVDDTFPNPQQLTRGGLRAALTYDHPNNQSPGQTCT